MQGGMGLEVSLQVGQLRRKLRIIKIVIFWH